MKKALIVLIIVLGVALAASVVYGFFLLQDKNALAAELKDVQNTLTSTQSELAATSQTLATTQQTLASIQSELDTTRGELAASRSEQDTTNAVLASTRSELATTNQTLAAKLSELSTASTKLAKAEESAKTFQDTLSNTQKRLAAAQETLEGLGITVSASYECFDVELVDNPEAKNPTWKELISFISKDKTENHVYILGEYDCSQFSSDVHNKAEAAGIRTAEVQVYFGQDETGHALNAFLTTDYGLVYIDCTQRPDRIVNLKAGKPYRAIDAQSNVAGKLRNDSWWDSLGSYFYMPSSKGLELVSEDIRIYW